MATLLREDFTFQCADSFIERRFKSGGSIEHSLRKRRCQLRGAVALQPLTLDLAERRIGIIGLNGSGKTTFARLINGLTKPTTGRVVVNGRDTADEKAVLTDVGFIFQSPQNQIILPVVRDDIAFGLKSRGYTKAEIEAKVDEVLAALQRPASCRPPGARAFRRRTAAGGPLLGAGDRARHSHSRRADQPARPAQPRAWCRR
jgi:ABC-type glutathione transport system ATPase component